MAQDPADPTGSSGEDPPSWGPPPSGWGPPANSAANEPSNPYLLPAPHGGEQVPRFPPVPKPGVIELRPLTLADLLDGTFAVIRLAPAATLGIAAAVYLLLGILSILALVVLRLGEVMYEALMFAANPDQFQHLADLASQILSHPWYLYFGIGVGAWVLSVFASALIVGTSTVATMRATLNLPTSFWQAMSFSAPTWAKLMGLNLLLSFAAITPFVLLSTLAIWLEKSLGALIFVPTALLLMALLVCLLWIGVRLIISPVLVVTQSLSVASAIKKSWNLTGGRWWRTFGCVLVTALIISVLGGILSSITGIGISFSPNYWAALILSQIVGALVSAVGATLYQILLTLIQADLRIRHERLDIALFNEISAPSSHPVPGHGAIDGTRAS
ncbi:hypothetical protein CQ018_00970 [Arthrobacter sp. MYb227]|uniref:glycerophosphoryl diester phosphodiesterase membrane domain-containing protein n=1 Tax=Arthrobacter sp. MYb227 TaxID=1848601 RepID=UPI000CFBC48F|nr:glycerophosphoryl diester phosphodiesterase membrane domain-containing protein [Arthrobacter sp. MYb227]PQZ95901.1 hypothetical protein CQ018_00970 [Arthrobacter sp. MYb227]